MIRFPLIIKAITSTGMAYALFQAYHHWEQYNQLAVIGTAFVHIPMAMFGTSCAWIFIRECPVFSCIAAAFVWLNAVLV